LQQCLSTVPKWSSWAHVDSQSKRYECCQLTEDTITLEKGSGRDLYAPSTLIFRVFPGGTHCKCKTLSVSPLYCRTCFARTEHRLMRTFSEAEADCLPSLTQFFHQLDQIAKIWTLTLHLLATEHDSSFE
jgi:hypothetical protein